MGFLKNVVKAIAAPVVAPIQAAVAVVKGEPVVDSIASGIAGSVAAAQPLTMANTASGGLVANAASNVPVVGGLVSQNIALGTQLSTQGGTLQDAAIYGAGQAAAAGAIAGAAALAPSIAAAAGGTAVPAGTGAVGVAGTVAKSLLGREPSSSDSPMVASNNETASGGSVLPIALIAGGALILFFSLKGK